jgi:hypothetical protein
MKEHILTLRVFKKDYISLCFLNLLDSWTQQSTKVLHLLGNKLKYYLGLINTMWWWFFKILCNFEIVLETLYMMELT